MPESSAQSSETEDKPIPTNAVPQPHGGYLVPGAGGGVQPGAGRPRNEFKDFLKREIRDDPDRRAALVKAAGDPASRSFGVAWKTATDYDEDKPKEQKELSGEVVLRIVRDG